MLGSTRSILEIPYFILLQSPPLYPFLVHPPPLLPLHTPLYIPMGSTNAQPSTSPWTPSSLCGKKLQMSILAIVHRQFAITPEDKFQYQLMLIQSITVYISLTLFLDQNLSITDGNCSCPTVTLATTFTKTIGLSNLYFWFGYVTQTIFNNNWRESIRINKWLSDQCQSDIIEQHTNNNKLGCWTQNHIILPDGVLVPKNRISDSKQNQFFSLFIKLGEWFAGKSHM